MKHKTITEDMSWKEINEVIAEWATDPHVQTSFSRGEHSYIEGDIVNLNNWFNDPKTIDMFNTEMQRETLQLCQQIMDVFTASDPSPISRGYPPNVDTIVRLTNELLRGYLDRDRDSTNEHIKNYRHWYHNTHVRKSVRDYELLQSARKIVEKQLSGAM